MKGATFLLTIFASLEDLASWVRNRIQMSRTPNFLSLVNLISTPVTYFINMIMQNNAGSRTTITWRDGIKENDIEEGQKATFSYNITSYVTQLPKYEFMVVRYGTNISELVNGQNVFEIRPNLDYSTFVKYTITSSGKIRGIFVQKQTSGGVLKKRCSENMQ